jgi:glutathione peroxidase
MWLIHQENYTMSVYSFKMKLAQGSEKALSDYQGKVLLVVNTASQCGFTPQYAGLQQLYAAWRDKGLEVLAFPCDQFGHQEPGSNAEIQEFCQVNYGVTFPVFAKIEVNGEQSHPLYQYLRAQKPGPKGADIQWNFTKFLIDQSGEIVERFESSVKPEAIEPAIEKLLKRA